MKKKSIKLIEDAVGPSNDDILLERYIQIGRVVAEMFSPVVEAVIHDYRMPESSVIAVFNSHITGRKVGDSITDMGERRIKGDPIPDELISYRNESPEGKPLKSSSLAIRNDEHELIGSLCFNFDLSTFQEFGRFIELLSKSSFSEVLHGPERFFPATSQDEIRGAISEYLISHNWQSRSLDNSQRQELVLALRERGYFNQRNAVTTIARELGVTRPTIYRYLQNQ